MSGKKNTSTGSAVVGGIIGVAVAAIGAIGLYLLNNDDKREKIMAEVRKNWRQSTVGNTIGNTSGNNHSNTPQRRTIDGENQGFKCSITQEVMREPAVLMNCGHTFQRQVILDWISREESCPICRATAQPHHVKPNYALKQAIAESKKTRR